MAKKKTVKKTKKTPRVPKFKKPDFTLTKQHKIVLGSLLMLFAVSLFIAFISFFFTWEADQSELGQLTRASETKNWMQKFGANISHFFIYKG